MGSILILSPGMNWGTRPRGPAAPLAHQAEIRGRAPRTASSGAEMAVLVGVLLSTMLLTTGAAYSISSTKDKLGSDVLGGSLNQKAHLEATVSSSFFAPAGGASTKGDRHWRVIPVGKFVQIGADSPIVC